MKKLLALVFTSILVLAPTTAAVAKPKPLPPLDIEIVKITRDNVVVQIVCPIDPPARITVGQASPNRQLAILEPVNCLRTRQQKFAIPLNPGVVLRRGDNLGDVTIQFSGDSGEMNNIWHNVVVGDRLPRGDLF